MTYKYFQLGVERNLLRFYDKKVKIKILEFKIC